MLKGLYARVMKKHKPVVAPQKASEVFKPELKACPPQNPIAVTRYELQIRYSDGGISYSVHNSMLSAAARGEEIMSETKHPIMGIYITTRITEFDT